MMKILWPVGWTFAVILSSAALAQSHDSDVGTYESARCAIKRSDGMELPGDQIELYQTIDPSWVDHQTHHPSGFDWQTMTHIEGRGFGDFIARDKRMTAVGAVVTLYHSTQESQVSVFYFKKPENSRSRQFAATWVITDSAKKEARVIELDCSPGPHIHLP